ncbi:protease modulator HflC [Desulfurivibrio alkaliphilus]|uniref:Protein HflC n=1 Tax=Desulfurivibrio alkaliphilus (strain DSM 19089 / UNIQEM U267 / AHT2) TaxID=589865 RepID=D6Z475_DESAT|nr:protease modulator HflC [Desulfurivibrio alkaliphilus]ADH86350.1 HflC protein [Desulfurivibrio alkaliphilus AHT 2]
MKNIVRIALIAVIVVLGLVVANGIYVLPEDRQAVVTQFGRPVGEPVTEAGLQFKLPFVQDVTYFDKRILTWDGDPNQIPTRDKTFVHIDATARWRIKDPLQFMQSVHNETQALNVLDAIIDGTVRDFVNQNNLVEFIRSSDWEPHTMRVSMLEPAEIEHVSLGRDVITNMIHERAAEVVAQYGIELVDVMLRRVNYIDTVQRRVFDRMISERKRIAADLRSRGEGSKAEILGKMERDLMEIRSNASREAQTLRGEADAEAARIYAEAYSRDPEFYRFYKTLETYQQTLAGNTRLVLTTESPIYRYLETIK